MQSEVAAQFFHNHASFNEVDASMVIDNTLSWCDSGGYDGGGGAGCDAGGESCDGGGGD